MKELTQVAVCIYFFINYIVNVTNSVWDYSPVDNLSSGRTITWTSLFWAFIGIILFMSGLISAFGSLMFTRKELALPNPTASMN